MIADLIFRNSSTIFVLESPHTSEIAQGFPLAGDSGMVFSRVLLNNFAKPAGEIIATGQTCFSIVNTFQNPLQDQSQDNPCMALGQAIRALNFKDRIHYNNALKELFSKHVGADELENYRHRLLSAISKSRSRKVVSGGSISQAYMEYAFKLEMQRFGNIFNINAFGAETSVFYVWHPSPRSGKLKGPNGENISAWEDPNNRNVISKLLKFTSS